MARPVPPGSNVPPREPRAVPPSNQARPDTADAGAQDPQLRRRLDEQARELAQLRATVADLKEALERATHAAEATAEARERFISNVSHELRTPLSAILLWASLIDEQKVADPELAEALGAIKRSAEEESALIDDIVDTSRLLSGKLRLEPVDTDLAAVVHEAVQDAAGAARAKHVALAEQLAPAAGQVQGDPRRLRQLVSHLLHNAVKFTPAQGRVEVDLQREGADALIVVRDTGEGLAPGARERLFAAPSGIEGKCARSGIGLGIGLLLARRIAELHGGSIAAESEGSGRGATFTVRLPLAGPTGAAAIAAPEAECPLAGRFVLLVSLPADEEHRLAAAFADAGARVGTADSAESGWAAVSAGAPDLIVATVEAPAAGGCALLDRLRQSEEAAGTPATPAIALTRSPDNALLELALGAGFQTAFAQPADPRPLVRVAVALLRGGTR